MLTHEMQQGSPAGKLRIPAIIVGVLLLGTLVFAVFNTNWQVSSVPPLEKTTEAIGIKLFGEGGFLLPVEITAIMLLSAVLGAIVMIREK
jgi:NADH-quinone oxidoreductase subunit J